MAEQVAEGIERAARALVHRYARLVDAKDLAGLGEIVTDDVELDRRDGSRTGREAFVALYRAFAESDVLDSLHTVTNIEVVPAGQDRWTVHAAFVAFTCHPDGARMNWGRYADDVVLDDAGELRLAAKRIRLARTALIPESMLAPVERDSFGSMD
ncbi:MAG: nuclear transport factor 2 family protein [Actinomycetales bacterium]